VEILSSPEQARADLARSFEACQLQVDEVWVAHFALGGNSERQQVEAYLTGSGSMSAHEHNVLAQAVNERLAELRWLPRAPYRQLEPRPPGSSTGEDHDAASP
jgi:hypothetical protein